MNQATVTARHPTTWMTLLKELNVRLCFLMIYIYMDREKAMGCLLERLGW